MPDTMLRCIAVAVLCMIANACASAPRGADGCDRDGSDTEFAGGRPVFRECNVDRPARFVSDGGARPGFTPANRGAACYSADLTFVVDTTGTPEIATAKVTGKDIDFVAHQMAMTVAVPAGSPPPSRPPASMPRC